MASLNALEKAFVRHAVAQELEKRDGGHRIMDKDFAAACGVHPNTIVNVKRKPAVQEAVKKAIADLDANHDYYLVSLKRKALEEMWANYNAAKDSEKRQWLKMVWDVVGAVEDVDDAPAYEDMTDEDLEAVAMKRNVSALGMSRSELRALVKGEK